VRFLVPPVPFFYRIEFEESTIPIVFRGPEAEIALLREKVDKPDFFVAFNVPLTELRPDREHTSTFTEDQLHLVGFSQSVQKLQHERRAAEGKGAWAYTILPAAATDEP
jgi:hypothetical protein